MTRDKKRADRRALRAERQELADRLRTEISDAKLHVLRQARAGRKADGLVAFPLEVAEKILEVVESGLLKGTGGGAPSLSRDVVERRLHVILKALKHKKKLEAEGLSATEALLEAAEVAATDTDLLVNGRAPSADSVKKWIETVWQPEGWTKAICDPEY